MGRFLYHMPLKVMQNTIIGVMFKRKRLYPISQSYHKDTTIPRTFYICNLRSFLNTFRKRNRQN